jgi:chemotaxis protein MotB
VAVVRRWEIRHYRGMARQNDEPEDPSGVLVYPKVNVPQRPSDPGDKMKTRPFLRDDKKKWIIAIAAGLLFGGIVGFLLRPSHKAEAEAAKKDAEAAQKVASTEKQRADELDKQLAAVKKEKEDTESQLKDASEKAESAEKKIAEADAIKKKLSGAIDKGTGDVSSEGDEIHLKLVDKVLFGVGDDQLTERGKQVLHRVAAAIKEIPDKQVWVQGHTDDTPIMPTPVPAPKVDPKKKLPPPKKGAKVEPVASSAPVVRFETNWELSAARALNVVHYLQDVEKIDPSRLAALAFGQYRPVSRANKAANRRIEIVLYPKAKLQK